MSKDEYLMLKNEINKIYDIVEKTRNLLYVTVAAIFTYSFSKKDPILFLIPFSIIIPCYIVTIDYQRGMWKIGAYLAVFHEGVDFNWERRLYEFNERIGGLFLNSYNFPYIFTGIASVFLLFVKCDFFKDFGWNSNTFLEGFGVLMITGLILYDAKRNSVRKLKKRFIQEWIGIKNDQEEIYKRYDSV